MTKLIFTATILVALTGCEGHDLRGASTSYLEPIDAPGQYRWKTIADTLYPIDSASAEAARKRQMEEALRLNAACPNGYVVENRQATRKVDGLLGDIYDVFYTIRCR